MSWPVKIGDLWDHDLGGADNTVFETLADGGMGDASFTLAADSDALAWGWLKGKTIEFWPDGVLSWYGRVHEPDRETGLVRCISRWQMGDGFPALDETGASTRDVTTAITQAQSLGWAVSRNGVSGTVLGDPGDPVSAKALLEMLATQEGKRVGLAAEAGSNLFLRSDPTEPTWFIATDDVRLSEIGEAPNAFAGRYRDATTGLLETRYWPSPLPSPVEMDPVDLTKFGRLTFAEAGALIAGAAELSLADVRWSNALEVPLTHITNANGVSPTSAAAVKGGQMVRFSLDVAGQQSLGVPYLDTILGKVTVADGSPTVTLEPVGAVAKTFAESLEAVAAR